MTSYVQRLRSTCLSPKFLVSLNGTGLLEGLLLYEYQKRGKSHWQSRQTSTGTFNIITCAVAYTAYFIRLTAYFPRCLLNYDPILVKPTKPSHAVQWIQETICRKTMEKRPYGIIAAQSLCCIRVSGKVLWEIEHGHIIKAFINCMTTNLLLFPPFSPFFFLLQDVVRVSEKIWPKWSCFYSSRTYYISLDLRRRRGNHLQPIPLLVTSDSPTRLKHTNFAL